MYVFRIGYTDEVQGRLLDFLVDYIKKQINIKSKFSQPCSLAVWQTVFHFFGIIKNNFQKKLSGLLSLRGGSKKNFFNFLKNLAASSLLEEAAKKLSKKIFLIFSKIERPPLF